LEDEHAPIPPTFLVTSIIWDRKDERPDHDPDRAQALADAGIVHDMKKFLSGEHEYVFAAPLIRAGERLIMSDRFDGLERRQGSRGRAMTLARSATEFRSPDGQLRAESRYVGIYLEQAPTSASPSTEGSTAIAPPVGVVGADVLTTREFGPVSLLDNVRYQGASGDMNPIHHDDEYARAAGYERAFSVGMLGGGYLATYCTDLFGRDTVRRYRVRFKDLVWTGDVLAAAGRVVREFDADGEHRVELAVHLINQHGRVVVDAGADFAVR
jgi:acyl dehydratase